MYNYSIIIPHKNIPKLLQRCLDSIPVRNDLEIIIVDDNSDPSIVDFSNFPGSTRPNTTIIFDKSGKGAGRARNIGLEHAKGKWLLFADADDMFTNNIEMIFKQTYDRKEDLIYFKAEYRDSVTGELNNESDYINAFIDKYIEDKTFGIQYKVLVPWGKIYSHKLITNNNICFEEVRYGNDTFFSALCGYYAQNKAALNIIGYCYMTRPNSLWHTRNMQWFGCRFNTCMKIHKFMKRHKESQVALSFKNQGADYLWNIIGYSKCIFAKNLLRYGHYTHDWKMVFYIAPKVLAVSIMKKSKNVYEAIHNNH